MEWLNRKNFTLYIYAWFLFFLVIRFFNGLFLFQIMDNPIRSPRIDPMVWIAQWLTIPDVVIRTPLYLVLDITLCLLPMLIIVQTLRNKRPTTMIRTHSLIFLFYVLVVYCYPTLSIRKYLGLMLIPFAFWFASEQRYKSYLELMRYYILFVFFSASMWKILRGVAWSPDHMYLSLKAQHIDNFVHYPDHIITQIVSFFVENPTRSFLLFLSAVVFQLSFTIGFFTKKYDKLLGVFLLLFIATDYLFMRIEYWEFIVFLPLFWGSRYLK